MENKKKRGGAGRGQGRKKGFASIAADKARDFYIKEALKDLPEIATGQRELAKGIWTEELDDKTGERIRVYKKIPDTKMSEYVTNQIIGRPKETMEVSGKDGKPFIIKLDR